MAKRVSERATRGGEHGGVGTPHARGASGEALGVGSDEASSISFCLRARWLVSSLTRRCGGPPAHLPSGRGPGYGGASEREIGQPNPVGGGFASGMRRLKSRPPPPPVSRKNTTRTYFAQMGAAEPTKATPQPSEGTSAAARCGRTISFVLLLILRFEIPVRYGDPIAAGLIFGLNSLREQKNDPKKRGPNSGQFFTRDFPNLARHVPPYEIIRGIYTFSPYDS